MFPKPSDAVYAQVSAVCAALMFLLRTLMTTFLSQHCLFPGPFHTEHHGDKDTRGEGGNGAVRTKKTLKGARVMSKKTGCIIRSTRKFKP